MKLKLSIDNYQLSILLLLFFVLPVKAQVTIGKDSAPHNFSILELRTEKMQGGLRLPQLTKTERDGLATTLISATDAAQGLVIYDSGTGCVEVWNADIKDWVALSSDKASIYFTDNDNVLKSILDPTRVFFSSRGQSLDLTVHDTPECHNYTVSTKSGSGVNYSQPDGSGAFTLSMDPNSSPDSRYAIITVKDNCMNQSKDFILVQSGTAN